MTIRLRPHHLLCLLTYAGKGYSPAFTANYDVIAGRIARGEDILIVEGPDDVCAPLLGDDDAHCWRASVTKRDQLASCDLTLLLARPIQAGQGLVLAPTLLNGMRQAFAENRTREACLGCEWNTLCTAIATEGYRATRLQGV
jgi:hypothetical protein